ncbi:MAG: NusG domain II-containing protein [Bacillota bacterium]|nr:NusG domain II-containing protein [Bacillota bacterium]
MKAFLKKHLFDGILALLLLCSTIAVMLYFLWPKDSGKLTAKVYVQSEMVLQLKLDELSENEVESYPLNGKEGEVVVEAKYRAIRIASSSCPSQYCVNQGWVSKSSISIVCAHNAVSIILEGGDSNEVVL